MYSNNFAFWCKSIIFSIKSITFSIISNLPLIYKKKYNTFEEKCNTFKSKCKSITFYLKNITLTIINNKNFILTWTQLDSSYGETITHKSLPLKKTLKSLLRIYAHCMYVNNIILNQNQSLILTLFIFTLPFHIESQTSSINSERSNLFSLKKHFSNSPNISTEVRTHSLPSYYVIFFENY